MGALSRSGRLRGRSAMKSLKFDRVDLLAGLMFVAFGLIFGVTAWRELDMGSARNMGPGYFPLLLAGILVGLGLLVILLALTHQSEPIGAVAWRGMALILLAPIVFGLTVRGLGFGPSVFLTTLIAAFASFRMKPGLAFLVAFLVAAFSIVAFSYGLGLPYPRVGRWLAPIDPWIPSLSPWIATVKGWFSGPAGMISPGLPVSFGAGS